MKEQGLKLKKKLGISFFIVQDVQKITIVNLKFKFLNIISYCLRILCLDLKLNFICILIPVCWGMKKKVVKKKSGEKKSSVTTFQ